MVEELDRAAKQRLVDAIPHWHHSIDYRAVVHAFPLAMGVTSDAGQQARR